MRPQQISVIIVSYNVRPWLRRCLASLSRASVDVVVVDNASSDGTPAMVAQEFADVHCCALADNIGFGAAVNLGAHIARGDAFLLLNPDAALLPGTLPNMAQALGQDARVWAVGFRQVDADGHFQLAAGPQPGVMNELARRLVQRRLDHGHHALGRMVDGALGTRRRVAWVAGSSLLVWRHAFAAVSGFDAGYFLYFEDIDFCLRLWAAGGAVVYDPCVTVMHHRGASAHKAPALAQRAYRDSQARFWRQHRGGVAGALVAAYAARRCRAIVGGG